MKRYFFLTFLLVVAFTAELRADYAVRFSDAVVAAGDEFTVDLIIENDDILGGAQVPFRWSSPDLVYLGFEWLQDRLVGNVTGIDSPPNLSTRSSSILIIGNREAGWISVGNSPVGRIRFRVKESAVDQYAFVDSVYQKNGEIVMQQANFSNLSGSVAIYPDVYPGVVRIGSPASTTMSVQPLSVSLNGEFGDALPVSRSLDVRSDSDIEFDWVATWSSDWLELTPAVGKTPAFPTLRADAFFLVPGVYRDTVVFSSEIAENSPIVVPVAFVVDTASARPPDGFSFALGQNRPSPFVTYSDPETRIPFLLEEASHVEISIFDILGRHIETLTSAEYGVGEAEVTWDGRDARGAHAASGHYICRMKTDSGESSRVIVLIR